MANLPLDARAAQTVENLYQSSQGESFASNSRDAMNPLFSQDHHVHVDGQDRLLSAPEENQNHNQRYPSFAESHINTDSVNGKKRKGHQYEIRRCVGLNGIGYCPDKPGRECKYRKPWESHFREKHLGTYRQSNGHFMCSCSFEDHGNGASLLEHIWNIHMPVRSDQSIIIGALPSVWDVDDFSV